jgi:hypothetical protein
LESRDLALKLDWHIASGLLREARYGEGFKHERQLALLRGLGYIDGNALTGKGENLLRTVGPGGLEINRAIERLIEEAGDALPGMSLETLALRARIEDLEKRINRVTDRLTMSLASAASAPI